MNKDLHDMDELFRSALDDHAEIPSAGVKENLDAVLDKKDAEEYKKRFIIWKRAALLLLLLLAGFVLYESGLIRNQSGHYTEKKSTPVNDNKPGDITATTDQNKTNPANSNAEGIVNNQRAIQFDNGPISSKNKIPGNPVNQFTQNQESLFSIITSQPAKKTNAQEDYNMDLQINKHGIEPSDNQIPNASLTDLFFKNILRLPPVAVNNLPLKPENDKNAAKKKTNPFKPFWAITPFASYEQVGYKLDSDDPLNATIIRHREAHEPSFSGGLLLTRQFTKRWSLQTGIIYSNTQIGISSQKLYALQDPAGSVVYKYITSSGYAFIKPSFGSPPSVGDSLTTAEAKHTLQFVSVPLVIKHSFGKNKLTITPGAGMEANFLTSAKLETEIQDASNIETVTITKLNGAKSFYWSAVAQAELQYSITKKISVSLRSSYRYALSPITKNNVVETFPHSFGTGIGLTFKF